MKKPILAAALTILAIITFSCARTVVSTEPATDRVLASWIKVNYGAACAPNDSGVYVLEFTPGTGDAIPDSSYVYAHYIRRKLDGNIASTNIQQYLEQLGVYTQLTNCSSDIWHLDQGYIPVGLEQIIKTLRVGGKAKIALPVNQSKFASSVYNAFSSSESDNVIYDIEIDSVKTDIYAYQDQQLKDFSAANYAGMDTLSEGFYYKVVGQAAKPDSISDEAQISFWYIGRTLDGKIFDTNVKDTARFYRIYSPSASYDSLVITYNKDLATMITNSQYVRGFTKTLHEMRRRDTVEVFFRSDMGYGESGSTNVIPEYSPLFFRVWLTETSNGLAKDDD